MANITAQDFSRRLGILITIRCLLGIVFICIVLVFSLRDKEGLSSASLFPLYIYGLLLLFFTVTGAIWLLYSRRQPEFNKRLTFYGNVQLAFDIFSVTLFVYFSGGVISPFSVFYIPIIIIGAFLFGLRGAILTGAVCYISYGLILVSQFYGLFPIYTLSTGIVPNISFLPNLFTTLVSFGITALLSGFLVDKWDIAEEHLRTSFSQLKFLRSLHENILDNIPSGVIVINQDKTILYANKMAGHILGLHTEKMIRKSIGNFFDFNFKIEEVTYLARKEMRCQNHLTGETLTLGYTIHSLTLSPKARVWILLFQDLTEIKHLQREMEEAERMSFIGRIAANIAHTIKNPLGAIHGAAQLIEKEFLGDPIVKRAITIITRETRKIDNIVRDFMKLSFAGLPPKLQENIDPFYEILNICQKFSHQKELEDRYLIAVDNRVSEFIRLAVNRSDFELIIWNLLSNATEAMPEGGKVEITLEFDSKELDGSGFGSVKYLCISVRDYGSGIAPEITEKIFQPFFTTKSSGTGLGLNIVSQVVKKYSGLIRLESKEGEGTKFFLYFPVINYEDLVKTACPDRI
ncbi:MAG: ATP-binding protein [Syntrophobacterales bacterium]|nr:ATP-binding protein [Syntrophobacterales bacterium]